MPTEEGEVQWFFVPECYIPQRFLNSHEHLLGTSDSDPFVNYLTNLYYEEENDQEVNPSEKFPLEDVVRSIEGLCISRVFVICPI